MKKYTFPEIGIVFVNTTDIMSLSIQGDGADPYRSAGNWRDTIDLIGSGLNDNGMD